MASFALVVSAANQFVIVSDIHFDPLSDPSLVSRLTKAEASQWESILAENPKPPLQRYGADTSWPLLSALVQGLQDVQPRPKLVVLTGDILPHRFREHFQAASASQATGVSNEAEAFRAFAKKTIEFVGLELEKAAGPAPVIYTIGNNDADCGDYELQPDGPFLHDAAATVRTMAHLNPADLKQWAELGSYETGNPLAGRHRIIALNSNYWSRRYKDACGGGDKTADSGQAVLTWLQFQLADAQAHGDKVWLVYHIPPGIDGHSSARANQAVPFWKESYAAAFDKLQDQYRKTIELSLAGHTHLDDIRLLETEHATSLVFINPAVSPNIGQNPAFRVVAVDSHARPEEMTTYYLPSFQTMKWQLEYKARQAYSLKKLDARSYGIFYQKLDSSPQSDEWKTYYSVSRPESVSSDKVYVQSLYCATGHSDSESYETCLKRAPQ